LRKWIQTEKLSNTFNTPPFIVELGDLFHNEWGGPASRGLHPGQTVIVKKYSGKGIDQKFTLLLR